MNNIQNSRFLLTDRLSDATVNKINNL